MSRLYNTKNKNPIVIKSIAPTLGTKKTEEFKKKLKNKSRVKKMGGGMMGRRMGYSQGSNGKIKFDAKKSDLDKSGDLSKYEKARGMAIAKAMSKRKNKKKVI